MLSSQTGAQMLSVILQSKEGGLIVVDGGWVGDADYLLQAIQARGGHVDAWLITHPDSDHAGALYEILNRADAGIAIDHIYTNLTDAGWYRAADAGMAPFVEAFCQRLAAQPAGKVNSTVAAGTTIQAAGIQVTVLNQAYYGTGNPINDSSVVYRADMNGVRILFLGDLGVRGGEQFLRTVPREALQADIVQMAHHGQDGAGKEVYEAIGAKICLWSAPAWLWDNDNGGGPGSGPWKTIETRRWMRALGADRNYVIKDGDIVLR